LNLAFKPEFLNRIDEIVRFRALTEADMGAVVDIQLRNLSDRLAQRRLTLEVTPSARAWLAQRGYDPAYGARPLKRLIQREIADKLAMALLEGHYHDGDPVVVDAPLSGAPVLSSEGLEDSAPGDADLSLVLR
jgi:ATP-dependent Clp protease ATP-binding subunit ClpB